MSSVGWQQLPPSAGLSLAGHGSTLVRLLHEGTCKLEDIGSYSEEELRHLLRQCGIPFGTEDTKVSVGVSGADKDFGSRLAVHFLGKGTSSWDECLRRTEGAGSQGTLGCGLQPEHDSNGRPFPPVSSSVGPDSGGRNPGSPTYWA